MLVSVRSNMFRNITAHFQHSAACVHHVSMSYLPRNGPVSARHSQQRNRARDGNGQRFAHFTCSRASAWLPAYLMIPVRAGGPMMSARVLFYERRNGLPAAVDACQYPSGGTVVSAKATELHNASARGRSRARWADRARVSHSPRLEGATGPQMCVVRMLRAVMSIQTPLLYVIDGGFCQFPHRTVSSSFGWAIWPMAARLMADAPKATCGPE